MEFLDKLVLPQSAEHINLLHLIAIIVQFIFIPFLSLVFGGTLFSIIYRNKGLKEQNPHFIRFSSELINLTTFNNTFGVILGIVPPLILLLIFSQILHTV
jgi:cytochrome c